MVHISERREEGRRKKPFAIAERESNGGVEPSRNKGGKERRERRIKDKQTRETTRKGAAIAHGERREEKRRVTLLNAFRWRTGIDVEEARSIDISPSILKRLLCRSLCRGPLCGPD